MVFKRIRDMREDRDLTQKELADKLYVSDKTVSKWECGKGMPDISMLASQLDEDKRGEFMDDILYPLLDAMENQDNILAADIISYELLDVIDQLA